MNKRLVSVLAFAFAVSLAASLLVYRLVSSKLGVTSTAHAATTQTLVAARSLALGTLITDQDVKFGDWAGPVAAGAITKKEEVIGRGVIANVYEGEQILQSRLAPRGAGAGMAATIPPGMRAVAVRVNEVVGVAGFVVPGMRVDVLISGNPPNMAQSNLGSLSKTLLQNIEVLSAGQKFEKNAEGKPDAVSVVNLLVTPEQAESLSLASSETRIQLVLRNPLDTIQTKTPGTAMANLFSGQTYRAPGMEQPKVARTHVPMVPRVAAPAPLPPPVVVEVIHGNVKTETRFIDRGEAK
jgi:pilus assembly protein CpaB